MSDFYENHQPGLESPGLHIDTITPSDTAELPRATRGLNVAESGFVRVTTVTGEDGTLFLAAGVAFPIRVRRVWASGTTATGIVGLS